jgi:HK97 gp10 family phage protein
MLWTPFITKQKPTGKRIPKWRNQRKLASGFIEVDLGAWTQGAQDWMTRIVRGLQTGSEAAIDEAFAVSQQKVPVRTGHLKSTGEKRKNSEYSWTIQYTAEYAGFVEHGTSRMRAHPYIEPAFQALSQRLLPAIKEAAGV